MLISGKVSGEDRVQFLHNQTTANFDCLGEGQVVRLHILHSFLYLKYSTVFWCNNDKRLNLIGMWHSFCDASSSNYWYFSCMGHGNFELLLSNTNMLLVFFSQTLPNFCNMFLSACYINRKQQLRWWSLPRLVEA